MKFAGICIAAAAFFLSLAWIYATDSRSEADMMKACVENGSDWVRNWGNHDCIRRGNK